MKTHTIIAIAAVMCFTVAGCGRSTKPIHLYAGLDASGSARKQIGAYVLLAKSAADQLQAGQDQLTMYRVDTDAHEFADSVYDGNVEETLKTVVAEVKSPASTGGTYPAKFWREVARRAQKDQMPVVILLMSDGDNDDMSAPATLQMCESARCLSKCPNVRAIVFCGAAKENWKVIRRNFAPLGDRLHLLSPTQLNDEAILPCLDDGRH